MDPQLNQQTKVLEDIQSPDDLRKLNYRELLTLAKELRETIITTVSETGGHLAPSLGVVELTMALHYVFNTPEDKLIWDVGHQAYAHKLLTGRKDAFHTLRKQGGISGFPKRSESEYDHVETGHSSTSISYGLGMATAKELLDDDGRVIAIIGDGSMTAGMAFEALNHAGDLDKNLIVILNDNEMSISENVGAMSSFLSRKMTSKTIRRLRDHIEERLMALSSVGENILSVLRRSEESLKVFLTPGILFEAFKFKYVGPIPGHDLDALITTLRNVRDHEHRPVLVHVITKKGKGYDPAEKNPGAYHGVGPFDIQTGKAKPSPPAPPSYTKIFGGTLCKLAQEDNTIAAITAAMPGGTGLQAFSEQFPERFFDVGIAEQHAVTFAAGLALEGMRPFFAVYSSFMQRALDQLIHDVCLPNLPVVIALDRSGVVGADGPTHHGIFDLSFLGYVPNLTIMAPKDENELQHMLFTAGRHNGPVVLRYPRGKGLGVPLDEKMREFAHGKGELLQSGQDILLLPVGNRVYPALAAAKELEKSGIRAAVINPRFIKPLDEELLSKWALHTGRVMTIEDNCVQGGFGASVMQMLAAQGIHIPIKILGHPGRFIEHASQQALWENAGIDTAGIVRSALEFVKKEK